jgi:hypothetical protein
MDDKQYNPAGVNKTAPAPGIASVDTDNVDERQQVDKKQSSLTEKPKEYDDRQKSKQEKE